MFEEITAEPRSALRGKAVLRFAAALCLVGAVFLTYAQHYFVSAFFVGTCAVILPRAPWLLTLACLEIGVGAGLTPHRPEFANLMDLFNVSAVLVGLAVAGIVLLCFKKTRRAGLWLLLGVILLVPACRVTQDVRRSLPHHAPLP
jgi:hypothetical protein